jgi:hypothetical protein
MGFPTPYRTFRLEKPPHKRVLSDRSGCYTRNGISRIIPIRGSLGYGFALAAVRWHVVRVGEKHARNPKTSLIARGYTRTECKSRGFVHARGSVTSIRGGLRQTAPPVRECHTRVDTGSRYAVPSGLHYSQFPFREGTTNAR